MTTEPKPSLDLQPGDRISPTWISVENYVAARIEELRKSNDKDMPPEQTAKVRGRIAELKRLLLQADPNATNRDV